MTNDSELLAHFADGASQEAFEEFVRRHIDLVYNAALRQLHGDVHRANEVTQIVFTDVARKARAIARHPQLVSWLHTSTRYAVSNLRRAKQARERREIAGKALDMLPADAPEPTWERLRPVLDEALLELHERDRAAVLLRFFEGRSFAEIGAHLALSENAARMRLERALDKLHAALMRRGITSTASALAVLLAERSGAAAPAGLAASIAAAAISSATGGATAPGGIATLLGFFLGSKTTITLTAVGTIALASAVYTTVEAHRALDSVAAAQTEHAALRARLADLATQRRTNTPAPTVAAGNSINALPAGGRPTNSNGQPAAAQPPSATTAVPRDWPQYSNKDPELWQLRLEQARIQFKAGPGLFLRGLGIPPEQIEQAATIIADDMERDKAAQNAGLLPPPHDLSRFRPLFGDAATDELRRWQKTSQETALVNSISRKLFYVDDPLSSEQAQRLTEIILGARLPDAPKNGGPNTLSAFIDWKKVAVEAEPILSPAQMKGIRNEALLARIAGFDPSRMPPAAIKR